MTLCPKCKSPKTTTNDDNGIIFITCNVCDYDELEEFYPQTRKSQREKTKHSPYKIGGSSRSRRKG